MKFHIITPTYNRANLLPRAIKSVLKQKYNNWHLYIIDDGSTDNTKEVVQKYLQKYLQKYSDKITYKYKENGGVGSARNVGINLALQNSRNPKNDWIIFLDSDDELTNDAFVNINSTINNEAKKADLIRFSVISSGGKKMCFNCNEGYVSYMDIINGCNKGECFTVCRLYIFERYKFIEGINGGEYLVWRKIFKEYKVYLSNKICRIYHFDAENSITRKTLQKKDIINQIKINELILNEMINELKNQELNSTYLVLARMYVLNGERLKSLKYFLKSFKYGINVKRIILYFLSLLPFGLKINNFLINLNLKKIKNN